MHEVTEKFIVHVHGDVPPAVAARVVSEVIGNGRVSKCAIASDGKDYRTYCWHTTFDVFNRDGSKGYGVNVSAYPNNPTSTRFRVWRASERERKGDQ